MTCVMKLRLKELRKERDLTQREVADLAGMSVSYYTELELGRKQINAHRMEQLARAFKVEPQELILNPAASRDAALVARLDALDPDSRSLVLDLIERLSRD